MRGAPGEVISTVRTWQASLTNILIVTSLAKPLPACDAVIPIGRSLGAYAAPPLFE